MRARSMSAPGRAVSRTTSSSTRITITPPWPGLSVTRSTSGPRSASSARSASQAVSRNPHGTQYSISIAGIVARGLAEKGLVDRTVLSEKPVAVASALPDRGRSLEPVIDAPQGGRTHLEPADTAAESVA
jgi:hypothetical protein